MKIDEMIGKYLGEAFGKVQSYVVRKSGTPGQPDYKSVVVHARSWKEANEIAKKKYGRKDLPPEPWHKSKPKE